MNKELSTYRMKNFRNTLIIAPIFSNLDKNTTFIYILLTSMPDYLIRSIFIGVLLFLGAELFSQKILLLENVHNMKNFKYYEGNGVMFKLSGSHNMSSDNIFNLTDSTIIFEGIGEVKINNICCIYRENWLIDILSSLSLIGGVAYFGVDSFNRMINHEYPVIQTETMLISGGMVAFGLALIPFRYRKINISENWRLKSVDPDSL